MNSIKKYIGISFLLVAVSFTASAQQNFEDFTFSHDAVKERKAIPYPSLREADVAYQKRIERIVDTREKQNLCLTWPRNHMGKIIFDHMSNSKKISAHVQSFVEVDVSNVWDWREKYKISFQENEGQKLTFTPIFISAIVKSLKEFPILNSSVVNGKIVIKRAINIGMATAVENGNLIVPVIKNADHLNLKGLAFAVNDLSKRARSNSLKPEEISDGTYTVTNVGNFGSIMGTPIINQPQVGIIAIGVIRKLPSVIETDKGDFVGIRKKLILSHTYDHRIINGSIGGNFVKRVAEYLEAWDMNQTI